jgi:hypothetical protein
MFAEEFRTLPGVDVHLLPKFSERDALSCASDGASLRLNSILDHSVMDRCPRLEATLWQRFAKVRHLGFPLETGIWAGYSRVSELVDGSHTTSRSKYFETPKGLIDVSGGEMRTRDSDSGLEAGLDSDSGREGVERRCDRSRTIFPAGPAAFVSVMPNLRPSSGIGLSLSGGRACGAGLFLSGGTGTGRVRNWPGPLFPFGGTGPGPWTGWFVPFWRDTIRRPNPRHLPKTLTP